MKPGIERLVLGTLLVLTVWGAAPSPLRAYSVLTHEAVIDSAWASQIRPLLLERFPGTTPAQLRRAHAYAYGGCIIQDLGYYPFGNKFFSDLTHYVRTGDFVLALLRDASDVNEYAFALGALAHYDGDMRGHPVAINRAVPIEFPKLRRKYGDPITYEDDPKAHIMVEFSFDVVQVTASGYLPSTYHDFIGFQVPQKLLDRAFQETYGLSTGDIFSNEGLAIGTYRRAASEIIPQLTRIAWKKRRKEILKVDPQASRRGFVYRLSRREYQHEWGRGYRKPHLFRWRMRLNRAEPDLLARILIFLFEILPKIGPLKTLSFRVPTPEADQYFDASYRATLATYAESIAQARRGMLYLVNDDLDTGRATVRGEYRRADNTYTKLLDRLADHQFRGLNPALRDNILKFYSGSGPVAITQEGMERQEKTQRELDEMRNLHGLEGAEVDSPPAAPAMLPHAN
jgi:Zinc dependent phospholipase C